MNASGQLIVCVAVGSTVTTLPSGLEHSESLRQRVAQFCGRANTEVVGDGSLDGEGDDGGFGIALSTRDLDGQLFLEQGFDLPVEAGVPLRDTRRPRHAGVHVATR